MPEQHQRGLSIQLRTILVVLPLLIGASLAGTLLSYSSSRRIVDQQASEFLAYRSAQLKDYLESQWLLLSELGLSGGELYQQLAEDAGADYAEGLIRGHRELIFARTGSGEVILLASGSDAAADEIPPVEEVAIDGYSGFLRIPGHGSADNLVAVTFPFAPFSWQVFVADSEATLYLRSRELLVSHLWILAGVIVMGTLVMLLLTHHMLRPIRTVVGGMKRVIAERSFSLRVPVEYDDEVGYLAHQFNRMNASLDNAYQRIRVFATSEALARREVVAREHETLEVMGRATDYKDPETGAHIVRVGLYSEMLARLLGESEESCTIIRHAAPLHDIGKLGIPDRILLKPGKLTNAEYELMKRHTLIAYDILKDSNSLYLKAGAEIALTHHERYDGSGYPHGLKGDEIPLFGRIVGLVDVFDALVSQRPYKPEWSLDAALEEIQARRGVLFDPEIVDLFVEQREAILTILTTYREEHPTDRM